MTEDRILAKLIRIRDEFEQILRAEGTIPQVTLPTDWELAAFTEAEAKDWLLNEPDFTKRIVTPLNSKRPPDKLPVYLEGGGNAVSQVCQLCSSSIGDLLKSGFVARIVGHQ
jgi:hypothetical protein